jgi:hypothetical protein
MWHEIEALSFWDRRLQVERGWNTAIAQRKRAKRGLERTGRAEQMSGGPFGTGDPESTLGMCTEHGAQRLQLEHIPHGRGGSVGIDVINVLGPQLGSAERALHGANRTLASRSRLSQMVGIGAGRVARHLGIDARSPRKGVRTLLQDKERSAFGDHEAIATRVPGTACALGLCIVATEGTHRAKPRDSKGRNDGLRTASDAHVHVPAGDGAARFPNRMRG